MAKSINKAVFFEGRFWSADFWDGGPQAGTGIRCVIVKFFDSTFSVAVDMFDRAAPVQVMAFDVVPGVQATGE